MTPRRTSPPTLNEIEQRLQQLTNAVVAGRADRVRQSTYAALARGATTNDILDALVEAVNILVDLHEVGEYDQDRLVVAENAINSCLQIIEERLARSEAKFDVKATVGPVGLRTGGLLSLVMCAVLRSVGFKAVSLGKTQTPLDILRNSEELGAALVVALLPKDAVEQQLRAFDEEVERGGFKTKFEIIPIAPGFIGSMQSRFNVARGFGEGISKATEWALKRKSSLRGE